MKKSIWNKNLFFEGLRRLRGLIITFAALSAVSSALLIVINIITGTRVQSTGNGYVYALPGLLLVFAGAPALASHTFSYLNKRKGSDFFHALPYTRTCLFLSFLSSLITAITLITALITAIGAVAYSVSGGPESATSLFFMMMLACYIASLYVSAVVVMTVSASGSPFTETVMSIVLIIFPQVLISSFYNYVISNVPTAVMTDVYRAVNYTSGDPYILGLPLRLVITFLGGYTIDEAYAPLPYIYTSVICVLYFAAAYLLFRYRKSETAERSAPSAAFQAVFRVIVTCAFSFIGILMVSSGFNGSDKIKSLLPAIIIFFALATVSYFIFELISSKGKKNLWKTLPTLAAVVVLNFTFLGALYGIYTYEFNFGTDPDKVSAVTVTKNTVSSSDDLDMAELAYRKILNKGYQIKNDETVDAMCREIKYVNENYRGGQDEFLIFNVRSGIITRKRSMNVFYDLKAMVKDEIRESEEYKRLLKTLPEQQIQYKPNEYSAGVFFDGADFKYTSYSQDDVDKVIDALKKELPGVDNDKWERLITRAGMMGGDTRIRYYTDYGYLTVPLSEELTPEAYKLAYEIVTKK